MKISEYIKWLQDMKAEQGGCVQKFRVGIDIEMEGTHYVMVEAESATQAKAMVAEGPEDFISDWLEVVSLLHVEFMVRSVTPAEGCNK